MQMRWLAVPVLMAIGSAALAASCPPLLEGQLPKLRAKESIDLCQRFAGKPLVIVNTASFCGFAPQFKGLEALYQRYKGEGLEVIGGASVCCANTLNRCTASGPLTFCGSVMVKVTP
jgi:glutathione peroxidase